MLQSLRKSAGSFVIKLLFLLLVASFAVWGIGDTFFSGGGAGNTVAEVGGRKISARELDGAYRQELNRLRGYNIDEQQARQLGLLEQVLERLVSAAVYDEAAQQMGITVSDRVVQQQIRQQFGQDIDKNKLHDILRPHGLTEGQFVAQLRTELKRNDYLGALTGGAQPPQILIDRLYAWRGEKRSANIVTVPVDPASAVAAPTPEQVEAYYKAHPADYTAPEYRTLTYIYLDTNAAAKTVKVPDEKLQEIYRQRQAQFAVPEKRTVLQMLVPDRAAADKAIDRIRKGEDFIAVAKDVAGQDESATRLGTVTKSELPAEVADAVFKLAPGTVSDPVEGPFGLLVIKVTDVQPGKTPTFEEVKAELAHDAAREQALDNILALTTRIEEALGTGATIADAAREIGVETHKIEAIDSEGQDENEKPITGLPAAPFLKVAFETKEKEVSLLTETDDNGFFVLHVDSIRPPAVRPLDVVRSDVVEDWKSDQRWQTARAKASKIVERLNNGAKIADIAKEMGLKVSESGAFNREGQGAPANMPSNLIADLFAAQAIGHAAQGDGVGGVNVAQLAAITPATPGGDPKAVESLKRSVGFGIANDIANQLVEALRDRFGVSVNQAAIRANFHRDAGES
jgi:peptidyl-prolyl cis-trans isomerase D